GAKALKVRAEYQAATQNELPYFAPVALFGVNEWTAFSQGNQKAFLQDSSRTGRAKATLARGPRVS
ncbi:MAG TPA: hypothetical protein VG097_13180, partial [Gemmata sp.]|nr:hypothetical protein [Gemmata sp.]